jgi:hypothetical protein
MLPERLMDNEIRHHGYRLRLSTTAENTWTVEIYAPTGECRETLTFGERSEAVAEAKIWVDVQTGRRAPA